MFLYEEIAGAKRWGLGKGAEVPPYILNNLSPTISLRDYQKNAIIDTILYLESDLSKNKQTHLLYHMATGSGKTVIMAMNILYYYNRGYRKFLFFTNQTSIVNKTKINFTDKKSSKYLFSDSIVIDGKTININTVSNFQNCNGEDIYICFNTVQGIHSELFNIKENSLTYEDFENDKIVLLADEAHHLNSITGGTRAERATEEEKERTWEYTISKILFSNKDNVLLEYTATCNLRDPNILNKYQDKIIFNFALREFRAAGYTKEFCNFATGASKWQRTLQALILSEFRKVYFDKYNIYSKPVVMLKSRQIKDSREFYNEFYSNLRVLTISELEQIRLQNEQEYQSRFLKNAFEFFNANNISLESLVEMIKLDFAEENAIQMNTDANTNEDTYTKVNTLDERNNHYRLIFTVAKLNEGWDVLGLYDIVRLYNERQGGANGRPSDFTISEAQLIGRGARYFPFKFHEEQEKDKKKYTNDIENPEAICETLLYHCVNDSRYITELQLALRETGFEPSEKTEVKYTLKENFKRTNAFFEGVVFVNERVEQDRKTIKSISDKIKNNIVPYTCSGGQSREDVLFENNVSNQTLNQKIIKLKDLPHNIVYKAYRSFYSTLSFDILLDKFPNLKSQKEFLLSEDYLGGISICFNYGQREPNINDYYNACLKVMNNISTYVQKIEVMYRGTKEFKPVSISKLLSKPIVRQISDDRLQGNAYGEGISQSDLRVPEQYRLDISSKDWYVYDDNKGTSEEKKFVSYFNSMIETLKKEYDEIYLIRNELVVKLYSFNDGGRFEPDYFLIMKHKKQNDRTDYLCVFIEPKGEHLLLNDKWKNDFLLELENNAIPVKVYADDNDYRIWGMPFYNESATKTEFDKYLKDKLL